MADIHLQPNNENVVLDFNFKTPQSFSYNVALVNRDRNQQVREESGNSTNPTSISLGEADKLIGLYVIISWSIIDPNGAGNRFNAEAVAKQNNHNCDFHQVCTGQTNDNASFVTTVGKFTVA